MDPSSILIIYTGGTIGMVIDEETGVLRTLDLQALYSQIPDLEKFNCQLEFIAFDPLLDSSNINPGHWATLAQIIDKHYEDYDGFVVLHGSDTMAYTASALSFMLENLNKPVIFTGSQLPLGMIRSDGRENFVTSIEIAAAREDDTAVVPEVAIYFENRLLRGNRTIKYNAEDFEAFSSGNYPPLAEAGVYIKYNYNYLLKPNFKKLKLHTQLDNRVTVLKLYPGISEQAVKAVLNIEGLRGVVLETYGSGNALNEPWFIGLLKDAIDHDIIIINVTQCISGSVEMGKYQTSVELGKTGVLSGHDITTESALAKMMYLCGSGFPVDRIKKLMVKPLRGEMTIR